MVKLTNEKVIEIVQEMVGSLDGRIKVLEQETIHPIKENILDTSKISGMIKHYDLSVANQKLFLEEVEGLMKEFKVVSIDLKLKK
jgi:hypothetical protein